MTPESDRIPAPSTVRRILAAPFALQLFAATLVTRLCVFFFPYFNGDETLYAALAGRVLDGALPFVGAVDHKPPGIVLLYAALFHLGGRGNLVLVHVCLLASVATTGWVLGRLAARLDGRAEARVAGLVYVVASTWGWPPAAHTANTELFLNLPLALAGLAVAAGGAFAWPLAGLLTGVAGLFKYQASLAGAAWVMVAVLKSGSFRERAGRLAGLFVGFVIVALAYVGFFVHAGAGGALAFWGWGYNFRYMSTLSASQIALRAAFIGGAMLLLWVPLLLWARAARKLTRRVALPWLLTMAVAIAAGGRFSPHYFHLALPPLSLLAGSGLLDALSAFRQARPGIFRHRLDVPLALAWAATVTVLSTILAWSFYTVDRPLARFHVTYRAVGAYLRQASAPGTPIFVWGNSSDIYYFAERPMATRFGFTNYHTGKIWDTPLDAVDAVGTEAHIVPRAWDELLEDLDRHPPAFLVDAAAGGLDRFDRHPIARYPALASRVAARYRLDATVLGVPIYRLSSLPSP